MFYIKHDGDGVTVKMEITDEAYAICPECGEEFTFDLVDFLRDPEFDLYSTQLYCRKCSAKRHENRSRQ